MKKPEPPKPPPMRCMQNYVWINEWELVEWYTSLNKPYHRVDLNEGKSNWFTNLFKQDYQIKLDKALLKNRMLCTESDLNDQR